MIQDRKIVAFTKTHAMLDDDPSETLTAAQLKAWWDTAPEETRVAHNALIDNLLSTTPGDSGLLNIGMSNIDGYTNPQLFLQRLNDAIVGISPVSQSLYRQAVINGNFDVWQRGTAQKTSADGTYFPDRFAIANFAGNASAVKIDRGTASPPQGSNAYLRYRLSTATAATVSMSNAWRYKVESEDAIKLIGKQVTVSFLVNSSISRNFSHSLNVRGFTGIDSGTDGTGLIAGDGDYGQNSVSLTAGVWTRVSKTFTIQNPSTGTGLATNGFTISLWMRYSTTGAETDTEYQFAQVQMNVGDVALPFAPRSYTQELELCQRYYERMDGVVGGRFNVGVGTATAATNIQCPLLFKVQKRVTPTLLQGGGFRFLPGGSGTTLTFTEINRFETLINASTSGVALNAATLIQTVDAGGWIAADAEL